MSTLADLAAHIGLSAGKSSFRRGHQTANLSLRFREVSAAHLEDSFIGMCATLRVFKMIECGAHEARASRRFVRLTGGTAVALEANPWTFEDMTFSAHLDGVDVRNMGIARTTGSASIFIARDAQTRTPVNASFLRKSSISNYQSVEVPLTTLDLVAGELGGSERLAVWIDVEGMASDVLLGGLKTLKDDKTVMVFVEVEYTPMWIGQATSSSVHSLLTQSGFTPVARDAEYERQYNIIYVKEHVVDEVLEEVITYWSALARIRANRFRPRSIRSRLGDFKNALAGASPSRRSTFVHRIAALLGSSSSTMAYQRHDDSSG